MPIDQPHSKHHYVPFIFWYVSVTNAVCVIGDWSGKRRCIPRSRKRFHRAVVCEVERTPGRWVS